MRSLTPRQFSSYCLGVDSAARSNAVVVPLRPVSTPEVTKRVAIVDGALACIAAKGLRLTTVDDVARASGMSRATLYRTIPGGREAIIQATVETEVARFFSALAVAMGAANTLEAALVDGITTSARWLSNSPALTTLLEVEPWVIMQHISFGQMDRALALAVDFTGPFFGRWLEPAQAARAADWAVRIVTSYLSNPSDTIDLTDQIQVRDLLRQFVLPGVHALEERNRS